ncbi:phosphotransferase [Yinghuangia sp. YIM S09857]|uniref:phosphotransferase n=1 Tax=Yinghuangia sp. YIM S09857 TaxID=3436929 RepID=UPI003F5382D8
MKERPADLDDTRLHTALAAWGIEPAVSAYAPVGFGDHHWTVEGADGRRWFATVADLAEKAHCGPDPDAAFDGLRRAMDTAATLADPDAGGLEFAVPPLRASGTGETVLRLGDRYALSVFPHVAAKSGDFGDEPDAAQRGLVIDLLARLHRAEPPASTPVAAVRLPSRADLESALADVATRGEPRNTGPRAEAAHTLLGRYARPLRRRLVELDQGAERLEHAARLSDARLVVTHGEPHPGNLMRDAADRPYLVDWDTVGLAVPERDLWHVVRTQDDLDRYERVARRVVDPAALAFYRLRWLLADTAEFVATFRAPHTGTRDTEDAWRYLRETLAAVAAP